MSLARLPNLFTARSRYGRIRTFDTTLMRGLLCLLSYTALLRGLGFHLFPGKGSSTKPGKMFPMSTSLGNQRAGRERIEHSPMGLESSWSP